MSSSTSSQRGASRRGASSASAGKKGATRRTSASSRTASSARSSTRTPARGATKKAAPRKAAPRGAKARVARRPAGPWVPIGVIVALAVLGWALYPALKLQYQTSRRVAGLEQKYDSLRKRNESLRAEVADLKTPEGVAKAARQSLGFTKEGENVYVVMPSEAPTAQAEGSLVEDGRSAVQIVLDAVFGVETPASVIDEP